MPLEPWYLEFFGPLYEDPQNEPNSYPSNAPCIPDPKRGYYEYLLEALVAFQVPSSFDSEQLYLPDKAVYQMNRQIESAIIASGLEERLWEVTDRYLRIFFILVYTKMTHNILSFLEHGFDDSKLPVEYNIRSGDITVGSQLSPDQARVFSSWHATEIREFCDNQWRFTVPTLGTLARASDSIDEIESWDMWFPQRTILPFHVEDKPQLALYNKVWKVRPDPDHLGNYRKLPPGGFMALKEAAPDISGARYREQVDVAGKDCELEAMKVMQRMNRRDWRTKRYHEHLTPLKGTFRRGEVLYMLFPWAEGGNLHQYWYDKGDLKAEPTYKVKNWIREQFGGLLGALDVLHNQYNYHHGNLKPENILVFDLKGRAKARAKARPLGRLALADIGLTPTKLMSGAQRYEPPEADERHPRHDEPRSRLYDVWSLGCVFLEFIIWLCRGTKGIEDFNTSLGDPQVEKFWKFDDSIGQNRFTVHPAVRHEIQQTQNLLQGKRNMRNELHGYLFRVLTKVENQMIVVNTSDKGNDGERDAGISRATSHALVQSFLSAGLMKHPS